MMSWWPLSLLFDSVSAEFPSSYSVSESVVRLGSVAAPWYTWAIFAQQAVGTVTKDRVALVRVRPFIRNDFKPQFTGRFVESDGAVTLVGRFGMRFWTKAFMSFWLGFCLLWTIGTTVAVLSQSDSPRFLPLAGLGLFAFGIVLLAAAKSWGRADIDWLSDTIRRNLTKST
jgi:hypothetical protein